MHGKLNVLCSIVFQYVKHLLQVYFINYASSLHQLVGLSPSLLPLTLKPYLHLPSTLYKYINRGLGGVPQT